MFSSGAIVAASAPFLFFLLASAIGNYRGTRRQDFPRGVCMLIHSSPEALAAALAPAPGRWIRNRRTCTRSRVSRELPGANIRGRFLDFRAHFVELLIVARRADGLIVSVGSKV